MITASPPKEAQTLDVQTNRSGSARPNSAAITGLIHPHGILTLQIE